jgi:dienelactone hydrolase
MDEGNYDKFEALATRTLRMMFLRYKHSDSGLYRISWLRILGLLILLVALLAAISVYCVVWYHRFYHHVTVQELSHEVQHSTFQGTIRGGSPIVLHLYQQTNASQQAIVLFTSGDGGWSPFCADVAAHIAGSGKTVVGFDMKDYLVNFASSKKPVSPDQLAQDYDDIIKASVAQPHVNANERVILAGWSAGAGYSVLVASDPRLTPRVDRVVAISLPIYSELAWKATDAVIYITHGVPRERVFDSRQYLTKLGGTPIAIFNATNDNTSPFRESQSLFAMASGPKHFYAIKAQGHHFEGGEPDFYRALDEELSSVKT